MYAFKLKECVCVCVCVGACVCAYVCVYVSVSTKVELPYVLFGLKYSCMPALCQKLLVDKIELHLIVD